MYIHWFPAHWRYTDMFAAGGLTYDEAQIVVQCGFVGFVLGGTLGHPGNWKPSAEIEVLKTFQSNLCFLHLHSLRWTGGRWQSTPGFPLLPQADLLPAFSTFPLKNCGRQIYHLDTNRGTLIEALGGYLSYLASSPEFE